MEKSCLSQGDDNPAVYHTCNQTAPKWLKLRSTLLFYDKDLKFPGGEIIGGKSGFTPEAGYCLISVARMKDGHQYMVISAKAEKIEKTLVEEGGSATEYGNVWMQRLFTLQ